MPKRREHLHLGVSLASAGWHPGAWREPDSRPAGLFAADHIVGLVQSAERGLLDFVQLDDALSLQATRPERVRGRLDALISLARVAPVTQAIGLVPVIATTHTEPFHLSKNLATLDIVSAGRAGWKVAVSTTEAEARHFGRKPAAPLAELYDEAGEAIDVVARLWDSWEDDAVIRDKSTGRYLDRSKVHYVDFEGRYFSVRGPSITPRSPQAHPPVVVDATPPEAQPVAARFADIALLDVGTVEGAQRASAALRDRVSDAGRDPESVAVLATVDTLFGATDDDARGERQRLDAVAGGDTYGGALDFVGTPESLVDLFEHWFRSGAVDGFLVRPALLPRGLTQLVEQVVPALRERRIFRSRYEGATLRDHFHLSRPSNRYAVTS